MVWGLTSTDFKNAGSNSLHMAGHYWGGMAVAAVINLCAHKSLKLQKDSWGSYTANAVSFAAGTALSIVLAPRSTLIDMAMEPALKLVAICLTAGAYAARFSLNFTMIVIPPLYFGSLGDCSWEKFLRFLPAVGGWGSALGLCLSNDILFPPTQSARS